jgi:hypothetical protein
MSKQWGKKEGKRASAENRNSFISREMVRRLFASRTPSITGPTATPNTDLNIQYAPTIFTYVFLYFLLFPGRKNRQNKYNVHRSMNGPRSAAVTPPGGTFSFFIRKSIGHLSLQ